MTRRKLIEYRYMQNNLFQGVQCNWLCGNFLFDCVKLFFFSIDVVMSGLVHNMETIFHFH